MVDAGDMPWPMHMTWRPNWPSVASRPASILAMRPAPVAPSGWPWAIAHGHPLGATGAGLMAKMLAGLEATDGQFGLQVMCIGHGMSTATILERI